MHGFITSAVLIIALAGLSSGARAGIIILSRLSELSYDGVNLKVIEGPGPELHASTSDLEDGFSLIFSERLAKITITGAYNAAFYFVSQNTQISDDLVFSDNIQNGIVTTLGDSPGLFLTSRFTLTFIVPAPTPISLTGLIVGSSNPASDDFARIQLLRGSVPVFSSSFSSLPFVNTLQPGFTYTLEVSALGSAIINGVTSSRALVTMDATATCCGPLESCANGTDDDGDGLADCADTDCACAVNCRSSLEVCNNGMDDDCDGAVDCADSDCGLPSDEVCDNGIDDDCDGAADCADDDCATVLACRDCNDPFADLDDDGDVDQDDFGFWQVCFTGAAGSVPAGCTCADWNGDAHVDATDLNAFRLCASGPAILAVASCDD